MSNSMTTMLMYFVITPMFILSIGIGSNMLTGTDYQTALNVVDTKEYNVDNNWSDKGVLNNLNTDGNIIYPSANEKGNWTSNIQDIPRARLIDYEYEADMRDGNGKIIVNAYKDDVVGGIDKKESFDLESGVNSRTLNLTNYDFFEFVFTLNETAGSSNQRPNVDYLEVDFDIVEGDQIGLDEGTTKVFYYLIMFLGVFSLSYITLKTIKEQLI